MEALDRCITGRGQATDGSSSLRWWAMARPVAAALLIGIATPTFASDPLVGITVAAVSGTETVSNSRPPLAAGNAGLRTHRPHVVQRTPLKWFAVERDVTAQDQ